MLQRLAALQPRAVPHRLRRRTERPGRAHDLRPQHRHPGGRRGQLRPPRPRAAAALHRRRGGAVREPYKGGTPDEQPGALPGDPSLSDFDRPAARRQHRPLLDLPRDVRAGLGPLRHGLAGGPPAARACGRTWAGAASRCRRYRPASRAWRARTSGSATVPSTWPRREPAPTHRGHAVGVALRRFVIGHTLPRDSRVKSVTARRPAGGPPRSG